MSKRKTKGKRSKKRGRSIKHTLNNKKPKEEEQKKKMETKKDNKKETSINEPCSRHGFFKSN